jgi:hypothetical protein
MKIRYIDLYLLNKFISKYNSLLIKNTYQQVSLNYFFELNKSIQCGNLFNNRDYSLLSYQKYLIFKFSICFVLLGFLRFSGVSKIKLAFYYIYYYEFFMYIRDILSIYWEFLLIRENVFCITGKSLAFLEINKSYLYTSSHDMLNFFLRNKVRLVLDIGNNLSPTLLHRLVEFDICILKLSCKDVNLQYLFLSFIYYLKEYSLYSKTIALL